ncbi:MAG: tRNA1(Val) (adenine(37)-N6)-methyltransferase [Xanthobacteraceae bacterium]
MQPELTGEITDDAALGGRLRLLQPRRGHRFGHDAILLAAAVPAVAWDLVVDLGTGVGTVGLAVAARVAGIGLALVEKDPVLADLAARNAQRNDFAGVTKIVVLDVTASEREFAKAGIAGGSANCVMMNPPFHEAGRTNPSRDAARRAAYIGGNDVLVKWIGCAEKLLCDGGSVTLIYRGDSLAAVLDMLTPSFGSVTVLPIHPKPATAAIRVIVGAKKGGGDPLAILPGLILNDAEGRPTRQAEDVLRHAAALNLGV